MNFTEKVRQFMQGRYGDDKFNKALRGLIAVCALIILILNIAAGRSAGGRVISSLFLLVAIGATGLELFRILSRNKSARNAENRWYMTKVRAPIVRKWSEMKKRREQSATHRFFKCPKCRQTVRVPKGKGRIRITCPKCGEIFERKS